MTRGELAALKRKIDVLHQTVGLKPETYKEVNRKIAIAKFKLKRTRKTSR